MRGPLGAAWMTLRRLRWSWVAPGLLTDHEGTELDLQFTSPRMVKEHGVTALRQQLERQVAQAMSHRGWSGAGEATSAAAVRRVIAGNELTEVEKGCLTAVATAAVWPRQRLADAGYDIDSTCQLCNQAPDTISIGRGSVQPRRVCERDTPLWFEKQWQGGPTT